MSRSRLPSVLPPILDEATRASLQVPAKARAQARARIAGLEGMERANTYSAFLILVHRGHRPRDSAVARVVAELAAAQADYEARHLSAGGVE